MTLIQVKTDRSRLGTDKFSTNLETHHTFCLGTQVRANLYLFLRPNPEASENAEKFDGESRPKVGGPHVDDTVHEQTEQTGVDERRHTHTLTVTVVLTHSLCDVISTTTLSHTRVGVVGATTLRCCAHYPVTLIVWNYSRPVT